MLRSNHYHKSDILFDSPTRMDFLWNFKGITKCLKKDKNVVIFRLTEKKIRTIHLDKFSYIECISCEYNISYRDNNIRTLHKRWMEVYLQTMTAHNPEHGDNVCTSLLWLVHKRYLTDNGELAKSVFIQNPLDQ